MVADGYYKGIVDNMGVIISKWDMLVNEAKEYVEEVKTLGKTMLQKRTH